MQLSAKGADAELTKDGIVSALGFSPQNEQWELITTVTTDADATWLNINADSEGNAYKLSKTLAVVDLPALTNLKQIFLGVQSYTWTGYYGDSTVRSLVLYAERLSGGIVRGHWSSFTKESLEHSVEAYVTAKTTGIRKLDTDDIAGFSFYCGGSTIPAGTVVNIYGIRVI